MKTSKKRSKIRIFPKKLVHGFCQKIDISRTVVIMQNEWKKSPWRSSKNTMKTFLDYKNIFSFSFWG